MALYTYEAKIATTGQGEVSSIAERSLGELDAITLLDIGQLVPEAFDVEEALYKFDGQYNIFEIRLVVDKKIPREIGWREAGLENFVAKVTGGLEIADIDLSIEKNK